MNRCYVLKNKLTRGSILFACGQRRANLFSNGWLVQSIACNKCRVWLAQKHIVMPDVPGHDIHVRPGACRYLSDPMQFSDQMHRSVQWLAASIIDQSAMRIVSF